jgi:hypothetical protein
MFTASPSPNQPGPDSSSSAKLPDAAGVARQYQIARLVLASQMWISTSAWWGCTGPVGDAVGSIDRCGASLPVASWGMENELLVGFAVLQ